MRLPSIGTVVTAAQRSAQRFPFVLAAGAVAALAGILIVQTPGDDTELLRLLAAATLGLPLHFGLAMTAERRARTRAGYWATCAAGVVVVAGFWYAWPHWSEPVRGMRYAQLSAAFHLFAAFAPFIGRREPHAFWQYNRILFLRFLTALLYSGVLWLGLSGALLATDKLLGVSVAGEGYARLWMLMVFVFNPWFFVAGIPDDIGALEEQQEYPRGLRMFTQYVLVPIVVIYLVILTLYFGKVVVTRQWPNGWIGWLVSSVAGVGILSWLLVRPLEEREEYAWVRTFTRGFYIALMPAIVMLWLAIGKRIGQYGVTEPRYMLTVLSLWLAGAAVFYTVSRSRDITLIPASLCAIALLSFAGPWGAYAVSQRSQVARLADLLTRNGLLADGQLHAASSRVAGNDAREIGAGFRYLLGTHRLASVEPWIAGPIAGRIGAVRSGDMAAADIGARAITTALNVEYTGRFNEGESNYFSYRGSGELVTGIAGYTFAVRLPQGRGGANETQVTDSISVRLIPDSAMIVVTRAGVRVLTVSLDPMIDSARAVRGRQGTGEIPAHLLTTEVHDGDVAAIVRLTVLAGTRRPARRITNLEGDLYLRLP